MRAEGAGKGTVVNFVTQLAATLNGIPNQEEERVDVAWSSRGVLFSSS